MFTFKHNRIRTGILSTAVALGLGLASSNVLAMGGASVYDRTVGTVPIERAGDKSARPVYADEYVGGRVGLVTRPNAARAEKPASKTTTPGNAEDHGRSHGDVFLQPGANR